MAYEDCSNKRQYFAPFFKRMKKEFLIVLLLFIGSGQRKLILNAFLLFRGLGFLAVVWFGSSPTPFPPLPSASCLSFTVFLCVAVRAYWRERGRGAGARSQIIRPQESLALYNSFNTLCFRSLQNNQLTSLQADTLESLPSLRYNIKFCNVYFNYFYITWAIIASKYVKLCKSCFFWKYHTKQNSLHRLYCTYL